MSRAWLGRVARWLLVLAIAGLLFWLGSYPEPLFAALTAFWQRVAAGLGLGPWLARLQHGTSSGITTRSVPAMVSYSLGYLALCLLLLQLLLRDARSRTLSWQLYLGAMALCALLLLLGRLGGNVPALYRAGRTLIDFLVSPLPVMVLLAVLTPAVRRRLLGS